MTDDDFFDSGAYGLSQTAKSAALLENLKTLTLKHRQQCQMYGNILNSLSFDPTTVLEIEDLPFLPVRLFKELELISVPRNEVFKTLASSGTTGQRPSVIFLDRATAAAQSRSLIKIMSELLGKSRLPMLIVDSESTLTDRQRFSARAAGIQGFSLFGREREFALDEDMQLRTDSVQDFLRKHDSTPILVFGFTFMVWQHFYKALELAGSELDLRRGVLIHGGGWKKLQDVAVDRDTFRRQLRNVTGLSRIYDYYGMVEQTGSIHVECEEGVLHAPANSEVVVRRPIDLKPASVGEAGVIQVLSILPGSYPGHSILTEDEGILLGSDDCPCGRKGRYFKVLGRLSNVEVRGCSDTYSVPT